MTYTLIDSVTLTSSASSVTFTGISAAGKGDLVLITDILGSGGGTNWLLKFNASSSDYYFVFMRGNGSTATSVAGGPSSLIGGQGSNTSISTLNIVQIMDYSATDKHKATLSRGNQSDTQVQAAAHRWANTAAITGLEVATSSNNFAVGSTFFLYQLVSE
jgi:hypothetical protein